MDAPGTRPRAILHLDLDAFFAAVEVLENPTLQGKPVVVGGSPTGRGVVSSASYPARSFGIHSAMPTVRALALCPHAIVLPPRFKLYQEYSRRVMGILRETSPLVEQMSIDEAFLEVTDLVQGWGEAPEMARRLQLRVRDQVGLSASLGVATSKLVAKVASERDKPGGLTVVRPGEEAAFLAPLPVRCLPGIGPVTERKLATLGVGTLGQLATLPDDELRQHFGRFGPAMARHARGVSFSPIVTEHSVKSVSQERTFRHDIADADTLRQQLLDLSVGVERRLRQAGIVAATVAIKLRYSDFSTFSRQMTLSVPSDDRQQIYDAAMVLFNHLWTAGRPVRLLGVGAHHLGPPAGQLRLW